MPFDEINWSPMDDAIGLEALLRVFLGAQVGRYAVYTREVWAKAIVKTMREASHLAWIAKTASTLIDNGKPVNATTLAPALAMQDYVVGSPDYAEFLRSPLAKERFGDAWALYDACSGLCRKIYRTAAKTSLPAIDLSLPQLPGLGAPPGGYGCDCGKYCSSHPGRNLPEDQGWASEGGQPPPTSLVRAGKACDLGIAPIIPIVLGVAAIAATVSIAWLESEKSEDRARVDIETARATAKAATATEIAKSQIAAGKPVKLPKELMDWGAAEERNTSTAGRALWITGIVLASGGAAYAGYRFGSKAKSPTGAA
jgi:hypothetical protein